MYDLQTLPDPELQTRCFLTLLLTPEIPCAHCPYLLQPSILHSCSLVPRLHRQGGIGFSWFPLYLPTNQPPSTAVLVSHSLMQSHPQVFLQSHPQVSLQSHPQANPCRNCLFPRFLPPANPVAALGPSCPLRSLRLLQEPLQRAFSTSAGQW